MSQKNLESEQFPSMSRLLVFVAFFISGFAALVYQLLWIRTFSDIIGSTSRATACIFSAYLLSLSFGSFLVGMLKLKPRSNLALYAFLEVFIGIFSILVTPRLMNDASFLTGLIIEAGNAGFWAIILADFGITFVIICLPVMAMGGTLPLLASSIPELSGDRNYTLFLYALNTIGAAAGAAISGFYLIKNFGCFNTLLIAMLCNIAAAVLALVVASRIDNNQSPPHVEPVVTDSAKHDVADQQLFFSDFLAFSSGFVVLATEIYWERAAKFFIGNRIQASALLLFSILMSLGIASVWVNLDFKRFPVRRSLAIIGKIAWLNSLFQPITFIFAFELIKLHLAGEILYPLLLVGGVMTMFASLTTLGTFFPYLIITLRGLKNRTTASIGRALFFNTVGCSLGSLTASFIGTRFLGTTLSIAVLSCYLLVIAVICNRKAEVVQKMQLSSALVVIVAYMLISPQLAPFYLPESAAFLFKSEDEYGFHSIYESKGLTWAKTNNSFLVAPAGSPKTSWAQEIPTHWSMLLASNTDDILVIGNGYGITAGAFRLYDSPKSVEAIEIMPYMVENLDKFASSNFAYYQDKRFKTILNDGKSYVELSEQKWDIINLNPSDPVLEGSANFYTLSCLQNLKNHLKPGGIFTVLLWGNSASSIVKTMLQVFPDFLLFPVYANSYVMLCPHTPFPGWEENLKPERFSPAIIENFKKFGVEEPVQFFKDSSKVARAYFEEQKQLAQDPAVKTHTVDRPVIEYLHGGESLLYIFNSAMVNP